MKKILFTGCFFTMVCVTATAQTALKIKLVPLAERLPSPPATLEEAYKLAHTGGYVNAKQDVYNHAQQQIEEVIEKIAATAPKETDKSVEKNADVAVDLMKSGNSFVQGSPEMQAVMKELYMKLEGDEKFAESFEGKSEAEKQAFIQELLKKHNVKASTKPVTNNDALGREAEEFKKLTMEVGSCQQNMETKYFRPLSHPDKSGYDALDKKEAAELKALPIITMGEYTGVDPRKEQAIRDRYFNEHMKLAKGLLEKDRQLWAQCKSDFLTGLARFDTKLAAIDWGGKLVNPLLRPAIAGVQKNLLEMAHKMLACEHIMTYNAATWYAAYLARPTTKKQAKDITMAYANIVF
jgi:hypothetical protein